MFARVKTVKGRNRTQEYKYLQVVESVRDNGKPRQRVVQSLGRIGEDVTLDEAKQIAYALLRFFDDPRAEELRPLELAEVTHRESRVYGNVVAVEHAWCALGLDRLLRDLAEDRSSEPCDLTWESHLAGNPACCRGHAPAASVSLK